MAGVLVKLFASLKRAVRPEQKAMSARRWAERQAIETAYGASWAQAGGVFADPYRADPLEHCPGKLGPSWRHP